jgi:hypothetical protein
MYFFKKKIFCCSYMFYWFCLKSYGHNLWENDLILSENKLNVFRCIEIGSTIPYSFFIWIQLDFYFQFDVNDWSTDLKKKTVLLELG